MHRLAERALVDVNGNAIDARSLLARGAAAFEALYRKAPKSDPANRILAAPETIAELRHALFDAGHPHVAALRDGHGLPPLDSPAAATQESTLAWRRERLNQLDLAFVESLAVAADDMDDRLAELERQLDVAATGAAAALGPKPSADELVAWFLRFYCDPANGVPYNGREGGDLYIYGGPWQAEDVLVEWFAVADDEAISAAVETVRQQGWEWVKAGLY